MTTTSPTIFLSHSSADRDVADRLVAEIERRNATVFYAPRDIHSGENYKAAIARALNACSIVVVLLSPAALTSHHVENELELAKAFGKPIRPFTTTPLKYPADYPDQHQYFFATIQIEHSPDVSEIADRLVVGIGVSAAAPAPDPVPDEAFPDPATSADELSTDRGYVVDTTGLPTGVATRWLFIQLSHLEWNDFCDRVNRVVGPESPRAVAGIGHVTFEGSFLSWGKSNPLLVARPHGDHVYLYGLGKVETMLTNLARAVRMDRPAKWTDTTGRSTASGRGGFYVDPLASPDGDIGTDNGFVLDTSVDPLVLFVRADDAHTADIVAFMDEFIGSTDLPPTDAVQIRFDN